MSEMGSLTSGLGPPVDPGVWVARASPLVDSESLEEDIVADDWLVAKSGTVKERL
jgi:hypothetical protein